MQKNKASSRHSSIANATYLTFNLLATLRLLRDSIFGHGLAHFCHVLANCASWVAQNEGRLRYTNQQHLARRFSRPQKPPLFRQVGVWKSPVLADSQTDRRTECLARPMPFNCSLSFRVSAVGEWPEVTSSFKTVGTVEGRQPVSAAEDQRGRRDGQPLSRMYTGVS